MSVVLDASALLHLWLSPSAAELADRLPGEALHAPAHCRLEASNVVRRQRNSGILAESDARRAFDGIVNAPLRVWPFEVMAERVWELGADATAYDGAYLALAEQLRIPLVTHDRKLARVPGATCAVEVF